jgi:hypothetical protein
MLSYPFAILEENGTPCEFALDDIYWGAGVASGAESGDLADGHRWGLRPNVPNPFSTRTDIRFELPAGGPYEIVIFDVAGRRVTGFRGVGTAGTNSVFWDGRDDAGSRVASEILFYRLEAGSYRETRKMTLIR